MANFKTHATVATSVSAVLAGGMLVTGLATIKAAFLYWLLGSVGGILPDIDSNRSFAAKIVFTGLGVVVATLTALALFKQLSLLTLCGIWLAIYLSIRYLFSIFFRKFTKHRGNIHSILAATFFALVATVIAYQFFQLRPFIAWFSGIFIFIGYLVHLILDELYSVDLANKRLKKSFGTALKIAQFRYKTGVILLILLIFITLPFTPSTDYVLKILSHSHTQQQIKGKLLP